LERTVNALTPSSAVDKLIARVREREFLRIVLTGMGSSFHALQPLNIELIRQGYTAFLVDTSELVHYQKSFLDRQTLVIAVSQSGRSAEIVRLLEVNERKAAILAVSNAPESLLAQQADAAILTAAGNEFSVSCKTYLSALLALQWLAGLVATSADKAKRKELAAAPSAVASYLACWENHVHEISKLLIAIRHIFFLGRGPSLAAAGTGALIVKESDHFHAEGMSCASFRHGPFEMLSAETLAIVFSGDPSTAGLNGRLVQDIREHGASAEAVGETASHAAFRLPSAPHSISPLLEILPVQMTTLALAALAGREPGRFSLASKVTTTE